MKDTLRGRPVYRIEEFANNVLTAPDGRPVEAISYYTDAAPPADGRPIDAVSLLLNEGEFKYAVSAFAAGVLTTPDGRPVMASALFDASGVPVSSFDPASLFAASEAGSWWDISDLATLWQDSARTIPAVVDGIVGAVDDKSGRGRHLLQGTTAAKPVLRSSGGLFWLEFDGVDDSMSVASIDFTLVAVFGLALGFTTLAGGASIYPIIGQGNTAGVDKAWYVRGGQATGNITAAIYQTGEDRISTGAAAYGNNVPVAFVVAGMDITQAAATSKIPARINGAVRTTTTVVDTAVAGTVFGSAGVTLAGDGFVGGASAMKFFGGILRAGGFDAGQLANVETYMRAKAGA